MRPVCAQYDIAQFKQLTFDLRPFFDANSDPLIKFIMLFIGRWIVGKLKRTTTFGKSSGSLMARNPANADYSEQEAQQRFEKLVRAALNTKPKPLKDFPKKWSGTQRKRRKKTKKATAAA